MILLEWEERCRVYSNWTVMSILIPLFYCLICILVPLTEWKQALQANDEDSSSVMLLPYFYNFISSLGFAFGWPHVDSPMDVFIATNKSFSN